MDYLVSYVPFIVKKENLNSFIYKYQLESDSIQQIVSKCQSLDIPLKRMDKGQLNNMTMNKPHQGVVLKATQLQPIELNSLDSLSTLENTYTATLSSTKALSTITFKKPINRFPFWIALDQVQDPQNLGSILRTAHFFGVDGVLVCHKNSAPLSPAVSKVSSGAMELMDIYTTKNLVKFLNISKERGWQIIGTDLESTINLNDYIKSISKDDDQPKILVFGNEGTGLRTNVKRCCNPLISIPSFNQQLQHDGYVDSLNVGVSIGVLVHSLLSYQK
ncbi:unnamed protein product [Cunninghamella echinulata]